MATLRFFLMHLLQLLLVLLGAFTVLFVVLYLCVPGDAAQLMLGSKATPQNLASLRHELGLDQPLWTQYGLYLWRLVHFDLGTSFQLNKSVGDVILDHLPATAYLAGAALLIESLLGLTWGVFMVVKKSSRWEAATIFSSVLLLAVPTFLLGILLQYIFASRLNWLPVSGLGGWNPLNLILPATALAAGQTAVVAAVTRAALSDATGQPFIMAARARGLSERQTLWRHAWRHAAGPVVTLLALDLGSLLGGAMITEIVFSWPGLGRAAYLAVQSRDVPLVTGAVLVLVAFFVLINSLVDTLHLWLDPRLRERGA